VNAGLPHANEVWRKTVSEITHIGNDFPTKVGGGWIAVQEDDWIAFAHINIGHLGIEDGDAFSEMRACCRHLGLLTSVFVRESVRSPWPRLKSKEASLSRGL
jgi:hypothetical protein